MAKAKAPAKEAPAAAASGVDAWKRRAGPHDVTLGSGQEVAFRLMGLGELIMRGAVPTHLRELVSLHVLNEGNGGLNAVLADDLLSAVDEEGQERLERHLSEAYELNKILVCEAVSSLGGDTVSLSPKDLAEIPYDDFEELVQLITGQRAFDSRGVRIGVEPLDYVARFHELHGIEGRPADCEACTQHRSELSSLHTDDGM